MSDKAPVDLVDINRTRVCGYLLEQPAPSVVDQLCVEVYKLQQERSLLCERLSAMTAKRDKLREWVEHHYLYINLLDELGSNTGHGPAYKLAMDEKVKQLLDETGDRKDGF